MGWRKPLKKFMRRSLTDYRAFISDSIGCENVKIIRIRAKVEFGLSFKNRLVKDLL